MFAKDVKNIEKQMSWETLIKKQVLTRVFGSMFVGNCGNVVRLIAPYHFWTAFSSHSLFVFIPHLVEQLSFSFPKLFGTECNGRLAIQQRHDSASKAGGATWLNAIYISRISRARMFR